MAATRGKSTRLGGELVRAWLIALLTMGPTVQSARAAEAGSPAFPVFHLNAPPKIAMLLFDRRMDGGWTRSFDDARQAMEKSLGVKIDYVDQVDDQPAHVIAAAEHFIKDGHNIIIGTGYDFSKPFEKLAERHPDVAFLNGSGTTNGPNLQSFYSRTFDSQYLCGMVAGAMSSSGHLGYVAARDIPVVNWGVNGFTLGARQTRPDATVHVTYTGTWADPGLEQKATLALIDDGADVIGQHVDTPRPQVVAQARAVYGTGHHRDMSENAPKATLCSSVSHWEKFLQPEIARIEAGTWTPLPQGALPAFSTGATDIVINTTLVPPDIIMRVMKERQALIDGKEIFAGPQKDANGNILVKTGQTLSDDALRATSFHVQGIVITP
jgi:basic membrane lipoprotein Med (substrate-binding protein (PBP1-ABC) superfamily)